MLIIGLGNPGARYEFTRHNIGFLAVDYIADKAGISLSKKSHKAVWGKGNISGNDVIIAKPQTFMNLSGDAVRTIAGYFHIEAKDIIVIYDDIDLELGTVRIRKKGGGGGHRGMESVIEQLGAKDFARIRLGIGRPERRGQGSRVKGQEDTADYVLSPFSREEEDRLEEILNTTKDTVDTILKDGIDKAMNRFNKNRDACA
ncbi:MAG: aminoacyl-tRNA hydrolase [Deltaproteobacteria bacterium GWC2_42_11]|nr:MAG: aminoacyl-tRNA hydrolase [Deltaproteobacteria bacterium GWC2_42_11]HBO83564.1 aminoacyl-tRNA hydrolase [Deltaproteobacteria bacterium]